MMFGLISFYLVAIVTNLCVIRANENSKQTQLLLNCRCSYGGLCLFTEDFKSYDIKKTSYQCNCEQISENIYENCSLLIDHCKTNICQNGGRCVSRFGAATCTCPEPFKGQYCQINNSSLIQVEDPMVYFIINSPPTLKKKLFIMARSLGEDVKVTFKSGASHDYVLNKRHFDFKKQRDICRKDRFYEDPKACDLIKGDWMVAEVELSYMFPLFHQDKIKDQLNNSEYDIPENVSKIYGKSDNVEVIFENQGVETYRHDYIFFYPYPTEVPYCGFSCLFEGCSTDPREVPKILLDQNKSVRTFLEGTDVCAKLDIGGMAINQSYSLIGPSKKIKNKHPEDLVFKYYDLVEEEGLHEIENEISSMQKRLHKGKLVTKYNKSICKCYLDITFGELDFAFVPVKDHFCSDTLTLKLENLNKLLLIEDMAFDWSCDQIDQFCTSKFGKDERLYKGLRCDTKYKFTVLITHKNVEKKSLKLEINIEAKSRQNATLLEVMPQTPTTEMIPKEYETKINELKIVTEHLVTTTPHVPLDTIPSTVLNRNPSNFSHSTIYDKTLAPQRNNHNKNISATEHPDLKDLYLDWITTEERREITADENEENDINDNKKRTICDGYGSKGKIEPLRLEFMCMVPIMAIFL